MQAWSDPCQVNHSTGLINNLARERDQLMYFPSKATCHFATWSLSDNMVIRTSHLMWPSPTRRKEDKDLLKNIFVSPSPLINTPHLTLDKGNKYSYITNPTSIFSPSQNHIWLYHRREFNWDKTPVHSYSNSCRSVQVSFEEHLNLGDLV